MFLRSNLHDTFLHSIYRQTFVEQFGDAIRSATHVSNSTATAAVSGSNCLTGTGLESVYALRLTWTNSACVHCRYSHDGSHHNVATYGADLVDLQVRQVAHMLTVDECVARDADALGSVTAQFNCAINVCPSPVHDRRPRSAPPLQTGSHLLGNTACQAGSYARWLMQSETASSNPSCCSSLVGRNLAATILQRLQDADASRPPHGRVSLGPNAGAGAHGLPWDHRAHAPHPHRAASHPGSAGLSPQASGAVPAPPSLDRPRGR